MNTSRKKHAQRRSIGVSPRLVPQTPRQWVLWAEKKFRTARLCYGHGTDNARDEAVYLIFRALGLPFDCAPEKLDAPVSRARCATLVELVQRRIRDRIPVAYLVNEAWFAGRSYFVDKRVLIPRSPIAEMIQERFSPWLAGNRARRILDVGTGSGCIAIACAHVFSRAMVDAVDVSAAALQVARRNVTAHKLKGRVNCLRSDIFSALAGRTYDIIVSNPPYVPARTWRKLPKEYSHEPGVALECGRDGFDVVRRLLAQAAAHLAPRGILVVEVGAGQRALMRAFPKLPFTWPEFEHGGDGVFLLQRADLVGLGA